MTISIQQLQPEHILDAAMVHQSAWIARHGKPESNENYTDYRERGLDSRRFVRKWEGHLAEQAGGGGMSFGAFRKGASKDELVGVVRIGLPRYEILTQLNEPILELASFYVLPNSQGQGVGGALIRAAEAGALTMTEGFGTGFLEVVESNQSGRNATEQLVSMYRAWGWSMLSWGREERKWTERRGDEHLQVSEVSVARMAKPIAHMRLEPPSCEGPSLI